ncbi:MAG: LPS export ABC transporter periplasmic protein LptC [Candidatus Omnitrophica bacterium]|nr:LPS export ABC transporter periplasmic protein LptC [Candidatus Omnitrophota bacterium]
MIFFLDRPHLYVYAQKEEGWPVIVNGDTVEYSMDKKEVIASGNVEVTYKNTRLTCERLTVNTETKDAKAEGNVRLEEDRGIIEGKEIVYNFQTKTGLIIDSEFRASPYFGRAKEVKKLSEDEFVALDGYMSTCSYDKPHYRITSKKIDFFMDDKVLTRNVKVYAGRLPILYLPQYNHSLKDPLLHVQVMPGKRRDWGPYMLTAWRYTLTDNATGRIYLDYRDRLGVAEGFGLNYNTHNFGRGDYKYYYTQERSREFDEYQPAEFQRYFIRWRHKWNIDARTDFTSEYYKIIDSKRMLYGNEYNFLKDYFYREYEKDAQPLSYWFLHHYFRYSTLDILLQKRTNRWYTQLEKLPEIKYSLPSIKILQTPFYFENATELANFNYKNAVPSSSVNDINVKRWDTYNKFSLPLKVIFLNVAPFVASRQTFYDKDVYGSSVCPRTVFYTGSDLSTKFYRIFNIKSKFLGMDINGLRHVVTPSLSYTYNHDPTVSSTKLKQIDSIDSIARNNSVALLLSNKLQTKRNDVTVDLLNLRVSSDYIFYRVDPTTNNKSSGHLSDILFDLELLPYSWMRLDVDAIYDRQQNTFSQANADMNFNFKRCSIGMGQRYQRKAGKELTFSFDGRINPKWKFGIYERYQFVDTLDYKRGLKNQQYTFSRDLHCWTIDFTYEIEKDKGHAVWVVFRLKAFPEIEFDFNQTYHAPKSGAQTTTP